jgi:bile acid transporter
MVARSSLVHGCCVLAALLAVAQGVEELRTCDKRVCVSADVRPGAALELTCGGTGEVITSFKFASYGTPVGTCTEGENDELFVNGSATFVDLTATPGCNATSSFSALVKACQGKKSCKVDLASFSSDSGLEGCARDAQLRYQVHVACGPTFDVFSLLITFIVALIGVGLGTTVEMHEFRKVLRLYKRAILVAMFCQYIVHPMIAFAYVKAFTFDLRVAIGIILIGSAPGGTTSNLMTLWAKGNVALSITLSAASTLAALGAMPLIIYILVNNALGADDSIEVPYGELVLTLVVAVAPAAIGIYIRTKSLKWAKRVEVAGSGLGVTFIVAALVFGILQNPTLFDIQSQPGVWICGILFMPIASSVGYIVSWLAGLPGPERRAVCLETGIQHVALVMAMIALSFTGCDRAYLLTFPLIASLMQLVNSMWMTALLRWSARFDTPQQDDEEDTGKVGALASSDSANKV